LVIIYKGIQRNTGVFPENVIGSLSGPAAKENTHKANADLSSYAISKLLRPGKRMRGMSKIKFCGISLFLKT